MTLALASSSQLIAPLVPAPAGVKWLDFNAAANRMGVSTRRIRQLAFGEWFARGQAAELVPDGGTRTQLHIREDAHPLLSAVLFPEQLTIDFSKLPKGQREDLIRRKEIYDSWLAAKSQAVRENRTERQATDEFLQRLHLDDGTDLSRATLYGWHRKFRDIGIAGLVDGRWNAAERASKGKPNPRRDETDPFLAEVQRLYLDQRKRSKQLCFDRAKDLADEQGWPVVSYQTAGRFLDKIPLQTVVLKRGGKEEFRAIAGPYIERDYSQLSSNEIWFADSHHLDLFCSHNGKTLRPWLICWLDARSRLVTGFRIVGHAGNSDVILAAFRSGCQNYGIPKSVYTDRGDDYCARLFTGVSKNERRAMMQRRRANPSGERKKITEGVFNQLGVEATLALPYSPMSKGALERFFSTVSSRFCKMFDSFCGRSPDTKPSDLGDKLKRGTPPLEEIVNSFGDWLEADYHTRISEGQGMDGKTPRQMFEACLKTKRTAPEGLLDVLCLRHTKPVKVGRAGVTYLGLHYGAHVLASYIGKWVTCRIDDSDLTKVLVFTSTDNPATDDKFICSAPSNQLLPVLTNSQDLREVLRDQNKDLKTAREYGATRMRLADSPQDRLFRKRSRMEAAEAQNQTTPPKFPPPALLPIQHALAGQMPQIRRAMESGNRRIAVGEGGAWPDDIDLLKRAAGPIQSHQQKDEFNLLDMEIARMRADEGGEDSADSMSIVDAARQLKSPTGFDYKSEFTEEPQEQSTGTILIEYMRRKEAREQNNSMDGDGAKDSADSTEGSGARDGQAEVTTGVA